jgi:hypothetical protein
MVDFYFFIEFVAGSFNLERSCQGAVEAAKAHIGQDSDIEIKTLGFTYLVRLQQHRNPSASIFHCRCLKPSYFMMLPSDNYYF